MGASAAISVRHLTRVEGHGNIVVDVQDGVLTRCDLEIVEAPRFFEVLLKGRPADEAARIACRICGICSVGHATASIHAVEAALGITPGPRLRLLRRLNMAGEWLQSHVLHLGFLIAPDAFGAGSVVPLAASHPEIVKSALRLKRVANEICMTVSGRHVMPISYHPGWMGHWPLPAELEALRAGLAEAAADLQTLVDVFAGVAWPALARPAEHVAALEPGAYPMMGEGASLHSTAGRITPPAAYASVLQEFVVDHSAAKHVRGPGGPIRVGALARVSLAAERLHPRAAAALARLRLAPDSANPFDNVAAQVVESVQAHAEATAAVEALLADPASEGPLPPTRPAGEGIGIVEVPRGTLVHHYDIGADGRIARANCIIPTAQNLASIEADMRVLVPTLLARPKDELTHALEMLVRAYDPCISCAVH